MEETVTHKGIIGVFLAIVLLVSMIAGAISPTMNVHAAEDYRTWSQKDERWAATAMGGSTVRDSGCYITSIAMVAAASGARNTDDFNPGVFAQQLNNIGAFGWDGSLMYWASVNAVIPEVKIETANLSFNSYTHEGKAAEMQEWLSKGYYVICNVGGHWVYVDSISGGNITMADPAKTDTDLFSAYYDVYAYQVLSGKNAYGAAETENAAPETTTTTSTTTTTTTTTTTKSTTTTTAASTAAAATNVKTQVAKNYANSAITTTSATDKTTTTTATTTKTTTSTTTTTTTTTTTEAATTEAASETTMPVTSVPVGEYYCSDDEGAEIYLDLDASGKVIAELRKGDIVNVTRVLCGWCGVNIDGTDAWIPLEKLTYAGEGIELGSGDINGDGIADDVDLGLLNNYIKNYNERPEGISTLRRCEIEAADINCDGYINDSDVLMYLMLICE